MKEFNVPVKVLVDFLEYDGDGGIKTIYRPCALKITIDEDYITVTGGNMDLWREQL